MVESGKGIEAVDHDLIDTPDRIAADVEVVGEPHQLSPDAELMLFRITQEALTNVQRHSSASKVCITVEFTRQTTKVMVSDNGKGFETPERMGDLARVGRLGLAGMQERAELLGGTLTIDTGPGRGTTLTVEVPLKAALDGREAR